jgi:hypothetical protein
MKRIDEAPLGNPEEVEAESRVRAPHLGTATAA